MRRAFRRAAAGGALVLAASAGAATAGERAAWRDAVAVEAMKPCPDGGFTLPGSAGCIRLSGAVAGSVTIRTGPRAPGLSRTSGFRTEARAAADVRIPTELGPLRAYASVRTIDRAGGFAPGR